MHLSSREQRLLNRISEAESQRDSGLASILEVFGVLAAGEAMPESEQLEMPAGRIKSVLRTVASPVAVLTVRVGTLCARARRGWRPAGPASPVRRRGGGRHARQTALPDA
ncbi:MAG: hypothetical protein JWO75_6444 [Actinomycetia bacterium]|nr:hypothetical protein [Actinomycetes bacterium]